MIDEIAKLGAAQLDTPVSRKTLRRALYALSAAFGHAKDRDWDMFGEVFEAALSDYPEIVIRDVFEPSGPIIAKFKFLPTIAEMRDLCDARKSTLASTTGRAQDVLRLIAEDGP